MAGTLTPTPYQTVLDGDGVAVSGAKIYTYEAGTTTNATTYTTSDLSVANANPIVADSASRYVAYLSAGANMRFIIKTSADVIIDDQDNVLSVPGASVNLDVEGTVGEAVTAGQVLYLSSASEASPLTAGLWYLTDADAAPTSTTPQSIGVAVSAIAINTSGTIRLAGLVTTAGAVVVGTTYYVSATAGALASSAPALSRQVGVAMTTSSLLLAATTAVASLLPNPITQDLLFTDNTYDIGKSGASRPRDLFASRNAVIDGTVTLSGGLNTPLVASQGGTGIASYTTNDFLRASGSTALAATAASAVFPYVSPLTTRGDTLVGTSGVAPGTRLAVGGANTFLSADGTDVSWAEVITTAAVLSKTANYTVTTGDAGSTATMLCDPAGGAFTVTLYAASGNSGRRIKVIKTTDNAHKVTIDGNASETINGLASIFIYRTGDYVSLICDGSNWIVEDYNITIMHQHSLSGNQTIGQSTFVTIIPTVEYWNWGAGYNTSTGIWTAPTASAGYYEVGAMMQAQTGADDVAYMSIFNGGTEVARWVWSALPDTTGTSIRKILNVASGDTLMMKFYQDGSASTTVNSGQESSWFSVTLIPGTLKWA